METETVDELLQAPAMMQEKKWLYRRRVTFCTIVYCLCMSGFLLAFGDGYSDLHAIVANNVILVMTATVGGYVFGRVMDPDDGTVEVDTGLGRWEKRRKLIFLALLSSGFVLIYLTVYGEDTPLNHTFANGFAVMAASTVASYVFGAAWDNRPSPYGDKGRHKY